MELIYDYKGKQKVNWIALTSRSGATLARVVDQSFIVPETIVSAKTRKEHNMTMNWLRDIHQSYKNTNGTLPIITLNGYMWIIPEDVCDMFEIYNLHPANLIKTPELVGKDPLERFFEVNKEKNSYTLGSTIHRVIKEVDKGSIISTSDFEASNLQEAYQKSFDVNVDLWLKFINDRKWEYGVFCE